MNLAHKPRKSIFFNVFILFIISSVISCQDVLEVEVEEIGIQLVSKSIAPENELMNNPYEIDFMHGVLEKVLIMSSQYNDDNSFTGMNLEDFLIEPNYCMSVSSPISN
jgi:hypothetical protein